MKKKRVSTEAGVASLAGRGEQPEPPKLARRKANKHSTWKSGRTIGEAREKLETASERAALHKKNEKRKRLRLVFTIVGFILAIVAIILAVRFFLIGNNGEQGGYQPVIEVPYAPTIEVIDADTSAAAGGGITSRMKEYIGQAEVDFRELGYKPIKAVLPSGSVREVDFYLEGYTGFIQLINDRETGVSIEDADRMIRYLAGIGIGDFTYIDVRIDGKAYWK